MIILSDRANGADRVPVSALMACGAVHHQLVRHEQRTRIGIVVETGEAREVHHHCLLIGYGADAINPYLAFESLWNSLDQGELAGDDWTKEKIEASYRKGVAKGMLKVFAKMGISTLASYKGAQIFEAVGLNSDVIDRCFVGTASRIKGVTLEILAEERHLQHSAAFPEWEENKFPVLPNMGLYAWHSNHHLSHIDLLIPSLNLSMSTSTRKGQN